MAGFIADTHTGKSFLWSGTLPIYRDGGNQMCVWLLFFREAFVSRRFSKKRVTSRFF